MSTSVQTLPLASPASAGHGCVPEALDRHIDLHNFLTNGRGGHFVSVVSGDSAVPAIPRDSLVIFDTNAQPVNGDIVVCGIGDLVYVKILEMKPKLRLVSPNKDYVPMDVVESDPFYVLGVVVGCCVSFKNKKRRQEPMEEPLYSMTGMVCTEPGFYDVTFTNHLGGTMKMKFPASDVERGMKLANAVLANT